MDGGKGRRQGLKSTRFPSESPCSRLALFQPLRLIIMSATLRVSDFADNQRLFPTRPPIIDIPARQHPVTVHFSRRTASDYVSEAVKKASKIHARLPPGGILIFLTGQNEITGVCRKLEARYGAKALEQRRKMRTAKTQPSDREVWEDTKTASVAPAQGRICYCCQSVQDLN